MPNFTNFEALINVGKSYSILQFMKAVIPVAGAGTKLRPLTYTQPKALIPIAGKTILSHIVDQLKDAGITEFIFIVGYLGAKIQDYVKQTYPDLTAIVYVNDSYALEGLTAIRQHNKRIPDDLSIASFDNSEFARNCPTPITSIAYDHFKEGQWAIKMLLDQIRHSFLAKSQLVFKGELIVRQSTSAPPK